MLREKGYFLSAARENRYLFRIRRYSLKELANLSGQLYLMINAGISVSEAVYLVAAMEKREGINAKLNSIYRNVVNGEELHRSLESHKDIFPEFFIKMVQLGEHSGNLEKVMGSLQEYYNRDSILLGKVKNSLTYPAIVFITSISVIMILMLKVMPQFADTLKNLGGNMPEATLNIINLCKFLGNNFVILSFLFISFIMALSKYLKTNKGKLKFHELKLKLPIIRTIYEKMLLSKFSRSLSTLLGSGLNIIRALEICSEIVDNVAFGNKIKNCVEFIKGGENLYFALSNSGINNKIFLTMVRTGEETGKVEEVLIKAASYFEGDLEEVLKKIVSIIEPVLVISMAFIIGGFIMSVMLPMMSVMDAIK
ncbi:MAG: type II secretion system F family protein [Solirubrobacterales bacterium]